MATEPPAFGMQVCMLGIARKIRAGDRSLGDNVANGQREC